MSGAEDTTVFIKLPINVRGFENKLCGKGCEQLKFLNSITRYDLIPYCDLYGQGLEKQSGDLCEEGIKRCSDCIRNTCKE